jgi:hypothetical protein
MIHMYRVKISHNEGCPRITWTFAVTQKLLKIKTNKINMNKMQLYCISTKKIQSCPATGSVSVGRVMRQGVAGAGQSIPTLRRHSGGVASC